MNIAIIGAGKLGQKVAEILVNGNHDITIIDTNAEVLEKLEQRLDVLTVTGNGVDTGLLKEHKIQNSDYLIACVSSDEANIVISSSAKKLGVRHVIARVREPEHMQQLGFIQDNFDIDYVINSDMVITDEIYRYLVEKYTLSNGIFRTNNSSLIEFRANKMPEICNKSLDQLSSELPNMLVSAVSQNGKIIIPHGNFVISPNDYIYMIGEKDAIEELNTRVHEKGKYTNIQKIMIIGGGKTGFYLAKRCSEFGLSVKLIESDKERCHYLSTNLNNVLVLHGDGTDRNLLMDENFDEMDAVVIATGFDEENLLLGLMAKQAGIEDVISKVSRKSYQELIESLGVDMALNPLDISASNIMRFIQGRKRVVSSTLIQGQAEILEIVASDRMALVNKPLKKLSLPDGVLVSAINRGPEIIIPNGDTVIQAGDIVTIFCLLSDISNIEKLIQKH
ncbi:MAG: Trk system potassium transporter TrkA [Clostridia bacterium]|nr:Trk system potassium transporter TrkA [Clostridia bacterium]